jgi:hypothetical protein
MSSLIRPIDPTARFYKFIRPEHLAALAQNEECRPKTRNAYSFHNALKVDYMRRFPRLSMDELHYLITFYIHTNNL